MAPKEKRKGQKEIHRENLETLRFYFRFGLIAEVIQVFHVLFFYWYSPEAFSRWNYVFVVLAFIVNVAAYYMLASMAKESRGPGGELEDAGTDINDSWIAEYTKDAIILTSGLQVLSAISNYVWLLWLFLPGYITFQLWTVLIWPWFTSGPPDTETENKKQRIKFRKVRQ